MPLTAKKIRDALPDAKTYVVWDDDPVGLGLRVWPSGKKVFILNYRIDRRSRRMNLGVANELSLGQAREMARDAMRGIRAGTDPLAERAARRDQPTVSDGLDQYLREYIPMRQAKGRMAEKTVQEYTRQIERNIRPKIGTRRIKDVTKADIEGVLHSLPPVLANRVASLLSAVFNQFEHWDYRAQHTNPVRGTERAVEDARDRTLSESELSALGQALEEIEYSNPIATLAIRLAALTGLRIGEIRSMRWQDLDLKSGFLILPKTKTGRRIHTLPTTAQALLAKANRAGDYVIAGRRADAPMNYTTVRNHWAAACRQAGIKGVRLHDLRRTIMTEAAALGVGAHLLRDMVGHKTTAMADRYARQAGAPLVELRERMGERIAGKMAQGVGRNGEGQADG